MYFSSVPFQVDLESKTLSILLYKKKRKLRSHSVTTSLKALVHCANSVQSIRACTVAILAETIIQRHTRFSRKLRCWSQEDYTSMSLTLEDYTDFFSVLKTIVAPLRAYTCNQATRHL